MKDFYRHEHIYPLHKKFVDKFLFPHAQDPHSQEKNIPL